MFDVTAFGTVRAWRNGYSVCFYWLGAVLACAAVPFTVKAVDGRSTLITVC